MDMWNAEHYFPTRETNKLKSGTTLGKFIFHNHKQLSSRLYEAWWLMNAAQEDRLLRAYAA